MILCCGDFYPSDLHSIQMFCAGVWVVMTYALRISRYPLSFAIVFSYCLHHILIQLELFQPSLHLVKSSLPTAKSIRPTVVSSNLLYQKPLSFSPPHHSTRQPKSTNPPKSLPYLYLPDLLILPTPSPVVSCTTPQTVATPSYPPRHTPLDDMHGFISFLKASCTNTQRRQCGTSNGEYPV